MQNTGLTPSTEGTIGKEVGGDHDLVIVDTRMMLGLVRILMDLWTAREHLREVRRSLVVDLGQGRQGGGLGKEGQTGVVVGRVALEQFVHSRLCYHVFVKQYEGN